MTTMHKVFTKLLHLQVLHVKSLCKYVIRVVENPAFVDSGPARPWKTVMCVLFLAVFVLIWYFVILYIVLI